MKFLPYVLKHLRRNWLRTLSTALAMAVCIFLFCVLQTVIKAVNFSLESASASRLVTRHAVGIVFNLPQTYKEQIAAVDGVKRVARTSFFGGQLAAKHEEAASSSASTGLDYSNFFANFAIDEDPYLDMYPEYLIKPEERKAFRDDLRGCVIGRDLANRFGWRIGDTFYLESFIPPYRRRSGPFEFVVRAIYDVDEVGHPGTDGRLMFFHYKYLYEGVQPRQLGVGTYVVEINDPTKAASVGQAIDALFENSDAQSKTETESAFRAGFISLAGNLAFLLNSIGLAVTFTILLVTANTMSMAVRERRTEIAVLKTLGFGSGQVMGLVVTEALLLGAAGGVLGIAGALLAISASNHAPEQTFLGIAELELRPTVALSGLGVALALGFAAGFLPAWGAYRARVTEMLRNA
jgi:putative ABC transport system permease protein